MHLLDGWFRGRITGWYVTTKMYYREYVGTYDSAPAWSRCKSDASCTSSIKTKVDGTRAYMCIK